MNRLVTAAFILGIAIPSAAQAQARDADVLTIDGIMLAFYEVVSVPAGKLPDFKRDSSLHTSSAQIHFSVTGRDGKPSLETLTLGQLHKKSSVPARTGMYERELHRVTQRFGSIAHVWSTYSISTSLGGPVVRRGISSVSLYFDGRRWWITEWTDEGETPQNTLPLRWEGCYTYTMELWSPPILAANIPYHSAPSPFTMDTAVIPGGSGAGMRRLRPPLNVRMGPIEPWSYWEAFAGDSASLKWTTGLAGVVFRVGRTPTGFSGFAEAHTDVVTGAPPSRARVTGTEQPCGPS